MEGDAWQEGNREGHAKGSSDYVFTCAYLVSFLYVAIFYDFTYLLMVLAQGGLWVTMEDATD